MERPDRSRLGRADDRGQYTQAVVADAARAQDWRHVRRLPLVRLEDGDGTHPAHEVEAVVAGAISKMGFVFFRSRGGGHQRRAARSSEVDLGAAISHPLESPALRAGPLAQPLLRPWNS